MLAILWVKSRHKKIRSVRTGKERAKKWSGCFNCSENVSQAQNGCKLVKNGYRFAKLRKYLCFHIGKDDGYVSRIIRLTLLSPEIIHAIIAETLEKDIGIEQLKQAMPLMWDDQKKMFGME